MEYTSSTRKIKNVLLKFSSTAYVQTTNCRLILIKYVDKLKNHPRQQKSVNDRKIYYYLYVLPAYNEVKESELSSEIENEYGNAKNYTSPMPGETFTALESAMQWYEQQPNFYY